MPGASGRPAPGPTVEDYIKAVYGNFPLVLVLIALITFVLLVRTFRSLLLPLKAVLLNLVSLAAVSASIVCFWQYGNGSEAVFDIAATGAITFWMPLVIFAFLFGLSMDYEVFILARMREEYDAPAIDRRRRSSTGLGRTGRLVTSAALILFLAFAALASAPGTDIKVLGHRARGGHPARRDGGAGAARARAGRRCSAGGTGGCPAGSAGCCGWSRRRWRRAQSPGPGPATNPNPNVSRSRPEADRRLAR